MLLLVAPKERRVRIEVGYGLEGTLTDALSKVIITNAITPRFKTGDFSDGISRGVDDIITVLTTDASEWEKRPSLRLDHQPANEPLNWIILLIVIVVVVLLIVSPGFRWFFFNVVLNILLSSGSSGSSGGSSAAADPAAADFPAAEARQAAAGPRGAGDEHFSRGSPTNIQRHPRSRSQDLGRDRLRAGASRRRPPRHCRSSSPPWPRSRCRGCSWRLTAMPVYRILSLQVVAFVILVAILLLAVAFRFR